jgi:hypothetical protein
VKPTFEVLADGRAIHCHVCGYTSWNLNDIRARYCGHCHRWHETTVEDNILSMWTVYDRPVNFEGRFVAVEFRIVPGISEPVAASHFVATTLEAVRAMLPRGLYRMPRNDGDEPQIVETWL